MESGSVFNNYSEQLKHITTTSFSLESEHWVTVTHVEDPHNFYTRLRAYTPYMDYIEQAGEELSTAEIKTRKKVIYYSPIFKKNIRGEIFYIDPIQNVCDIFAIDYGSFEKSISLDVIYSVLIDFKLPPLALHCKLASCQPIGDKFDKSATEAMIFYIGKEIIKMIIKSKLNDQYAVELINTRPDIATLMALTGYSVLEFGGNTINRLSVPAPKKFYFTFRKFEIDYRFRVRVLSGKSLSNFYVADVKDYKQYLDDRVNFTYFSKKCSNFSFADMRINQPVSVIMQQYNKCERAIIKECIDGNKAIVQFVDTGLTEQVNLSCMKVMSDKFFHRTATAIYCSLINEQVLDYRLQKYLYPGTELTVIVKEPGHNFDKPNVIEFVQIHLGKCVT